MLLAEWEIARGVPLSSGSSAILRAQYAREIELTPSWSGLGTFDLRSKGYIGALALPDTDLILTPKVPLNTAVYMLTESENLPQIDEQLAPFEESSLTVFIAQWYARLARPLVERFMLRRYRVVEETTMFVRGRIDLAASTRLRVSGRPEFECAYDDYTANVVENQIIRAATHLLLGSPALPARLAAQLHRIAAMLAEVEPRLPRPWERRGIIFDRLNGRYRPVLRLAEWILRRSSPEIAQGEWGRRFNSFLVDMGDVFERFVIGQLIRRLKQTGLQCRAQASQWLDADRRLFRTVPDLVVTSSERGALVLDTKYKRFGGSFRPSESDVYQVLTYCATRGARRGVLAYPKLEPDSGFTAHVTEAGVSLAFYPIEVGAGRRELHRSLDELAAYLEQALSPHPEPLGKPTAIRL